MSFLGRVEINIKKLERNIEKKHEKINEFRIKYELNKISRAEFNVKKKHIEEKIGAMDSRMQVLKGGLVREKHHFEEKAEENKRKKEEKARKKEERKQREKRFLEHT